MPDDVVNLAFSGSFTGGGAYSGNVNVDYSTNVATGSISASYNGNSNNFDLGSGVPVSFSDTGAGANYGISVQPDPSSIVPSISASWIDQTPETLSPIFYYYPDYQFPANAFDAPVTSTVVSLCLVTGSLIATERGDVPVEDLAVGDRLLTLSGALRPIHWIGHRRFDCSRDERARALRPVQIAKDALGAGKPWRDVRVSCGHAICIPVVDELLVPAGDLINGATVAQVDLDQVVYWHVELDSHDVIFANGLPVESYRDVGNRNFFTNVTGLPQRPPSASRSCRPMIFGGDELQAIRARMRARALDLGWRLREAPISELRLMVDNCVVSPRVEEGHASFALPSGTFDAWLLSHASAPLHVSANIDGRTLGVNLAGLAINCNGDRRTVALDDVRLLEGFHETERQVDGSLHRWTSGRARLPRALWAGCSGDLTLEVQVFGGVAHWVAPRDCEASIAPAAA